MRRCDFIKVVGLSATGVLFTPVCVSAAEPQGGWRWCKKCEGLWYAGGAPTVRANGQRRTAMTPPTVASTRSPISSN